MAGRWDSGRWGTDRWAAGSLTLGGPSAGWGADWQWWAQLRAATSLDLTPLVVEARWSTDSHTMGDGAFRGDIQPGRLTLALHDPDGQTANLDKMATFWAHYVPTGATWCWFSETVTRPLSGPADPLWPEVVVSATPWPGRLVSSSWNMGRAAEAGDARLNAIVSKLATDTGLWLPPVGGRIARARQWVPAVVDQQPPSGIWPGYLALIRDAASDGVAYWEAHRVVDHGELTLVYDRWDTAAGRAVAAGQLMAGPIVSQSTDWVITQVMWHGMNGTIPTDLSQLGGSGLGVPGWGAYGIQALTMRVYADISTGGADNPAVVGTGNNILTSRGQSSEEYLSALTAVSGKRFRTADGAPSDAWDPAAHVWSPIEVLQYQGGQYRVTKTDHVLNARGWTSTHTLEKYTAPVALP